MIYKSLLSASIVGAASASTATPATWKPEFTSAALAPTSSNLCGGKGTLVAALATSGASIDIVYPQRAGKDEAYTVGQIVPADADLTGFAADIECVGDDVTGNILFATRGGTGATAPGLFVYSGSWSAWTEQQFIPGPEETFGTKVTTDDMRTVIVSCPACENSAGEAAGQLYVYKATSPSAKAWTKTQVLELDASKYSTAAGTETTVLGAQALVASHGVVIADFMNAADENEAAIFVRHPDGSYSHQQVLNTGFATADALAYNRIATYDGVIAYSEYNADVGGETAVGSVYVLSPFSGVKGKPLPTKWSQQQVLGYDDTITASTEFGSALFMNGNELAVAAALAVTEAGLYSFHKNGKMWSQTGVLLASDIGGDYADGDFSGEMYQSSLLVSSTSFFAVLNSTVEDVRCLDISVSDMFGDGWDGAVLRVTGPDGTQDDFAPNCASISSTDDAGLDAVVSHLEFKYCPIDASAGGLHKFRVVGGPEAKHNWEINWAVRNQMEDLIIYGGVATEVDFDFNVAQRRFNHLRVHHPLPNATKCIPCPDHPPHPIPDVQDDDARWIQLEVVDPADTPAELPWYLRKYGPSFFIGDKESHRLAQAAPFCINPLSPITKCWMDVHDGEYTFRMADANYNPQKDHKATVCGVEVGAQQQLIFNISKGVCDSQTMAHDAETMCASYDVIVHGLGVVVLRGVSVSSLADLSAVDKSALESALLSSISGVAAVDSKLIGVSNGNEFTYKLAFKSSSFGSAPQGGENQERFASIETTIVSQETSTSAGNNIYSFMKAMPLDALNSATGAVVSTFSLVGLGDATTEHLSVQDVEIGAKLTYVNSGSSSQDAFVSMTQGAYVAAGLCAVAVALFVVTRVAPVTKKATPEVQTA